MHGFVDDAALEVRVDDMRDAVDELDQLELRERPVEELQYVEDRRKRVGRLHVERARQQEHERRLARHDAQHAAGRSVARGEHQQVRVSSPLRKPDDQLANVVVVLGVRHRHVEEDHQLLVVCRLDRLVHAARPVGQLRIAVEATSLQVLQDVSDERQDRPTEGCVRRTGRDPLGRRAEQQQHRRLAVRVGRVNVAVVVGEQQKQLLQCRLHDDKHVRLQRLEDADCIVERRHVGERRGGRAQRDIGGPVRQEDLNDVAYFLQERLQSAHVAMPTDVQLPGGVV